MLDGVQNATDRVLIAAKVGSNLVGIAEVSLPNGDRFGAESYRPKAPADKPYLSDVSPRAAKGIGERIGKALVLAAEETMREMGETVMYTHTKVDNEGAQKLFEKCGYSEPDWAKKGLTQAQIAQRSTEWNPFAAVDWLRWGTSCWRNRWLHETFSISERELYQYKYYARKQNLRVLPFRLLFFFFFFLLFLLFPFPKSKSLAASYFNLNA